MYDDSIRCSQFAETKLALLGMVVEKLDRKNASQYQLLKDLQQPKRVEKIRGISWWLQGLYSIILLVIGTLLGVFFQEFIKNGFNLTLILLAVPLIAQIIFMFYIRHHLTQDKEEINDIYKVLRELEGRLGLEVEYQSIGTLNKESLEEGDKVIELITKAEKEILVLDYNDLAIKRYDYSIKEDLRIRHYDTLLKQVEEQSIKNTQFIYKRICQFNPPESTFNDIDDPVFVKHCRAMLAIKDSQGKRVYLKRTALAYPLTFLMVDRKHIVLHITGVRRLNNRAESYLKGEIIIHDPQQELIEVFWRSGSS